jgi:hypothetical protein
VTFIQRAEGEAEAKELRRELSNTYVALSEIYMTDLCDNEEAETESRRYIQVRTVFIYFIQCCGSRSGIRDLVLF